MSAPFFRAAQDVSVSSKPERTRAMNPWQPIRTPDGRVFRIYDPCITKVTDKPVCLRVTMYVQNEATQDARDFEVFIYWEEIAHPQMEASDLELFPIARREVGEWLYGHRSALDLSAYPYPVSLHFPPRPIEVPI